MPTAMGYTAAQDPFLIKWPRSIQKLLVTKNKAFFRQMGRDVMRGRLLPHKSHSILAGASSVLYGGLTKNAKLNQDEKRTQPQSKRVNRGSGKKAGFCVALLCFVWWCRLLSNFPKRSEKERAPKLKQAPQTPARPFRVSGVITTLLVMILMVMVPNRMPKSHQEKNLHRFSLLSFFPPRPPFSLHAIGDVGATRRHQDNIDIPLPAKPVQACADWYVGTGTVRTKYNHGIRIWNRLEPNAPDRPRILGNPTNKKRVRLYAYAGNNNENVCAMDEFEDGWVDEFESIGGRLTERREKWANRVGKTTNTESLIGHFNEKKEEGGR
ncbi:hypothetical protein BC832DRAFT_539981 [Gaertneriomyces semiglobifer]|nr:hypothetical protein BC832DRAFT_539981 [Gaertneriomyces semiglobifer]